MKLPSRVGIIHLSLAMFVVALVVQTGRVQLWQKSRWTTSALRQQSMSSTVPAPRGDILDERGQTLAQSRETVRLGIAPPEVANFAKLKGALAHAGIPPDWIARATDPSRRWVSLPGRYVAIDVAPISAIRGVYTNAMIERSYAFSEGTRRIVGRVDAEGRAVDGVELALDSLLTGVPGSATVLKDGRGRHFDSPAAISTAPRKGNSVMLTINQELQEIAERELAGAVSSMRAEGGDVVVIDPRNGEVLAMASQRSDPRSTASTALTEPYEPGSTLKPFIAATLLEKGRAVESDIVQTYGGQLTINGRTIFDEHKADQYTLAEVIRQSSNVGIVQFALRLDQREEYEALRDFGFGSPTGVPYPVESAGILHEPARWSTQSANSLAMGYEVAVTPLQLVVAYVAIANGGELLEPTLVKEVRGPDNTLLYRHQRRVVRRVVRRDVARRVLGMMVGVVEGGGTAKRADLGTFCLAGKTGTSRRSFRGRYDGAHIPTFVGVFPCENPQFVILVKLDNPKGSYMGGLTAAPVTRTVIQAALASRNASLDRKSLAASRHERPLDSAATAQMVKLSLASQATRDSGAALQKEAMRAAALIAYDDTAGTTPFMATLPALPAPKVTPQAARAVPMVRGLSVRQAVRVLHAAGFRVELVPAGPAAAGVTTPTAGTVAPAGTLVHLAGTL